MNYFLIFCRTIVIALIVTLSSKAEASGLDALKSKVQSLGTVLKKSAVIFREKTMEKEKRSLVVIATAKFEKLGVPEEILELKPNFIALDDTSLRLCYFNIDGNFVEIYVSRTDTSPALTNKSENGGKLDGQFSHLSHGIWMRAVQPKD